MSNLSDKEIDRLSREAADSYEPDHSSLSWSRLEQKLIEQMPERPPDGFRFGRINPNLWGPAVVLLAGISFYFIKNNFYSKLSTRTNQTVTRSIPASPAEAVKAGENAVHLSSVSSAGDVNSRDIKNSPALKQPDVSGAINANDKKTSSANRQVSTKRYEDKNAVPVSSRDKTAFDHLNPASDISNTTITNKNSAKKVSGSKGIIPVSLAAAGSPANNRVPASMDTPASGNINGFTTSQALTSSNDNTAIQRAPVSLPLIISSGASLGKIKGNDSLLNRIALSKAPIRQKSVHVNRSLNLGLAFGPDYTDAGGITNNQLSNNIGITVGYYLTNKFSVNTGIFYSNKFYWSPGKDYDPRASQQGGNTRTYAAPPEAEYVNGACNMYELPLTLRYDFAANEKTKFFVNAGLSSYFMLKQTYIYFFHSGGRTLAWKTNDESQVNYWFGVADLSFGLETDMGKGFSFQAEPFFKLPLRDMGMQNLKLNSYGFLFSFRYAPVLSRTKKY